MNIAGKRSLFYPYTVDNVHPGFSVDCVIFGFHKKKLWVLLNKFDINKYWQLPGGFMFKHESSDEAIKRVLEERTGLKDIYMKQFHLFTDPARIVMEQNVEFVKSNAGRSASESAEEQWFLQRFISLGYYAFVKYDDVHLLKVKEDMTRWFDIGHLPLLYSDHENIIKTSMETIRSQLPVVPIGYELLPEKFTMGELRRIYEIILDRTLDRRNFQRKALASGVIIQLDEIKSTSSYNPPILYAFDRNKKDADAIGHALSPYDEAVIKER